METQFPDLQCCQVSCSIITVPRGRGNTFQRAAAYNKPGWVMHMDNNEIMKSLEGFDEVWKRVTAARPEAAACQPEEAPVAARQQAPPASAPPDEEPPQDAASRSARGRPAR